MNDQDLLFDLVISKKNFFHLKNVDFSADENWIARYLTAQQDLISLKKLTSLKNIDLSDKNNQCLKLALQNNNKDLILFLSCDKNIIKSLNRKKYFHLNKDLNDYLLKFNISNF
jgi:hypothetical protein